MVVFRLRLCCKFVSLDGGLDTLCKELVGDGTYTYPFFWIPIFIIYILVSSISCMSMQEIS